MGKSAGGGRLGSIAHVGAVVLASFALANCSSSKFSNRVIADGDPVPKGGGSYHVGEPYRINGRIYYPAENPSYRAEGVASWYGPDFHGRLTANGEIFDMHAISAAHPTLPIPSFVRVTNLDNGRSMIVRVNDRGPYARGRLIDLSIGAAKALGFYGDGLAHVRVEYVGRAPLEGSDDRALLATLREGRPAQPSPQLMLASTAPVDAPANSALARAPVAPPAPRSRKAPDSDSISAASAAPVASFAPPQNDREMGLMSGRGLY